MFRSFLTVNYSKESVKSSRKAVTYLLGEPAGVPVDAPGANGDTALGDGSLEQPFVVGSKGL